MGSSESGFVTSSVVLGGGGRSLSPLGNVGIGSISQVGTGAIADIEVRRHPAAWFDGIDFATRDTENAAIDVLENILVSAEILLTRR